MRRTFTVALGVFLSSPLVASATPVVSPSPKARPEAISVTPAQTKPTNLAFQRWIDRFRGRARAAGIRDAVLTQAFQGIRYNADVIQKDRNQSEFTKQIWEYLDSAASETRVKNGRAALRANRRLLSEIESRYGVEAEVVTAVWGLESAYGSFRGDVPIIEALATLAFDGRRGKFFESQLIAALKIIQSGDVAPRRMTGSWAGAMGHTQFIPTSYLAYAVDFRGDGKRDIWSDNPTDALASTAAYLKNFGWKKGQPWGVEVTLPRGFNYGLTGERIKKTPTEWAALGVRDVKGGKVPNHGRASILLPAGAQGAAFMIFNNFHVIERYNTADAYVIGVGHLSDRIGGAGPLKSGWPRGDRNLRFSEKKEMQRLLTSRGYNTQGVDGIIGPNTIAAIRKFQSSQGMTPDGYASYEILRRLR
ncbi:MAG: lytic murein transglycosylase [Boseongicola sp.]|nr:lytic murein transglycosylase [Boseongicola sp.]